MKSRDRSRHSKIQYFGFGGARWDFGPAYLIIYAQKYLAAAQSVATMERAQEGKWHPVCKYLACHSLELSLKAFLGLRGQTMKGARAAFAHNLNDLLVRADTDGLTTFAVLSDAEKREIEKAHTYYSEKVFEYPSVIESAEAYPLDPDYDLLESAAAKLVSALYDPCMQHDSGPRTIG
jgi:hypothetical protein